ncbi:hypothetical protein AALP_AA7G046500 [Arabis alpina]|uniref:TIR domain-containing protein n=1 Tax=Arabis alpina TaxID=50452 RepID=A0A087GFX7_ARAAL|nr:hypothetical protein AALP_AA7G046500 [Arabis alpina]
MDSSFFFTILAAAIGLFLTFRKFRSHQQNKENSSSSSSSPPPPPSSSHNWTYHVFPSFRGEDVRKDFLSHIQKEFGRKGITPFIDNDIKRGESIGPDLIKAIRGSKIAVVLVSKNYASSKWCLDELVEIMKCREEVGQTVMAIFYKVDPSHVKKLTRNFGKVFRKTCAGNSKKDIERWRQALVKVATIAGYDSSNWDNEAAMIEKIATDVSNELINFVPSSDFDGFVGMRAHMENMNLFLRLDSNEVKMIGIWGPSGIGKSTIARVLYSTYSHQFQLSVFMENIKRHHQNIRGYDEYSSKLHLQKEFLSHIINHEDIKIHHLGVAQDMLKDKRVLVVLDDVDQSVQLDAMAKEVGWFGSGSRIIITTQDKKLLNAHGISHIYERQFLVDARDICKVLNTDTVSRGSVIGAIINFSEIEDELDICDMALESMSCIQFLRLNDGKYYQNSYLPQKYNLPRRVRLLDWKWFPKTCLPSNFNLEFLVELKMQHSKLVKLWGGTKTIRNLKWMDLSHSYNLRELPDLSTANNLRELDLSGCSNLVELPSSIGIAINLRKLLLLNCSSLIVIPSSIGSAINLEELNLHGCSALVELPSSIENAIMLKQLDLGDCSSLVELPSFIGNVTRLEDLNLRGFSSLVELPYFIGNDIKLKRLNLSGWSSLVELPSTIGKITSLEDLDLSGCSRLVKLSYCIGSITNLRKLNLSGCSRLAELQSSIGNSTNLEELNLTDCSNLVELPSSIGNATNLEILNLSGCSKLVKLPSSMGNVTGLGKLDLSGCSSLAELPSSIGNITRLWKLDLNGCSSLVKLPSSIGNLHKLSRLRLKGCSKLEAFPFNMESLVELDITDCSLLKEFPEISTSIELRMEEIPPWSYLDLQMSPWIKELSQLYRLEIKGCTKLVSLPQLPDSLRSLDAENCESLESLHCSFHNNKFSRLEFANCFKLNREARDLIISKVPTCDRVYLPGEKVSTHFTYRATGNSLSMKLNGIDTHFATHLSFKACVLLVNKGDVEVVDWSRMRDRNALKLTLPKKHRSVESLQVYILVSIDTRRVTIDTNSRQRRKSRLIRNDDNINLIERRKLQRMVFEDAQHSPSKAKDGIQ